MLSSLTPSEKNSPPADPHRKPNEPTFSKATTLFQVSSSTKRCFTAFSSDENGKVALYAVESDNIKKFVAG
jgi:hypothetical protein